MNKYKPPGPPRKWVKIRDLANAMKIEHPSSRYRAKFVRRLIQRMEKRDGVLYMRQYTQGRGTHWYVSPAGLEALEPDNPTAFAKLRRDIDDSKEDISVIRRQLNGHGSRIRDLEKFRRATDLYIRELAK